jgi:hypothetical protein
MLGRDLPISVGTLPTPFSPASVPLPQNRGGGVHTRLRVRGWGIPNSDDWKKILALCLLCGSFFQTIGYYVGRHCRASSLISTPCQWGRLCGTSSFNFYPVPVGTTLSGVIVLLLSRALRMTATSFEERTVFIVKIYDFHSFLWFRM